jgi:two-component system chemotaxis response regulator CheY
MTRMTRTILIVEDNEACRESLELALAKPPWFAVHAVATAEEALECLAGEDFCALVTDLHLGSTDGFDLIAKVRSHPFHRSLPILVVSGDTDPSTPARVAVIGADAYFSKPYSPAALSRKLEQLVSTH